MTSKLRNHLFINEEKHKNAVYEYLDENRKEMAQRVELLKSRIDAGGFEDQVASFEYGTLARVKKDKIQTEEWINKVYYNPYFAHVELLEKNEKESEHYFLSDSDVLEKCVALGDNRYLVPFKLNKELTFYNELYHCYQSRNGEPIKDNGNDLFYPQLICNDRIEGRELIEAVQLFPAVKKQKIVADELLEERLRENRNNSNLQNIISTLQSQQFEIIQTDPSVSFVVQGCPGSGKSQCLFHRLFYLRDFFSEDGWEHVLLLTPTQLFRNYSSQLIKRYQLSTIDNCSIADLYKSLLNAYDSRFKNRQYNFELTEEYLPNGYLQEIYHPNVINRIGREIEKAIVHYVEIGCNALEIDFPDKITSSGIDIIVKKLDDEIKEFDAREKVLLSDEQYAKKREEYDNLQIKLNKLNKTFEKFSNDYDKIEVEIKNIDEKFIAKNDACQERNEWVTQRDVIKKNAIQKLNALKEAWEKDSLLDIPCKYANQLSYVNEVLYGEHFQADEEYLHFLNEYCSQVEKELEKVLHGKPFDKTIEKYRKRQDEILNKKNQLSIELEMIGTEIDEIGIWIKNYSINVEGEKSQISIRRSEMDKAKYYLSRIESTVFEREVWNALLPIKEKYGIQVLDIEELDNGRQKESRILYKSDLLFYLMIYSKLYSNENLPRYQMICIDEGQDLHRADYEMLKTVFPNATFNIFGDLSQVLHESCGIHNWKEDTGVHDIFSLNCNYRNTAPIVVFCNLNFMSNMEYIGNVKSGKSPQRIFTSVELKEVVLIPDIVLIVRDRKIFERLCAEMGKPASDFEFLDSKSEKASNKKISCYSIFAAKGLEFSKVLVCGNEMTKNQKIVACTRAMGELYYYE